MKLLEFLQASGQDHEWYPTTDEMLAVVARNIKDTAWNVNPRLRDVLTGVLDIGAGDGRALAYLKENCEGLSKFMAIEKSDILAQQWPGYVFPVGCDFLAQSLIDKPVQVIFCNPPYSEYAQWACKIIREGFFSSAYLVIPRRWKESHEIQDAIADRKLMTEVLWSGDFRDAERAARATVDIVRLHHGGYRYGSESDSDPFSSWFDSQFTFHKTAEFEEAKESLRDKALVKGRNLVDALEELYHDELDRLYASYKAITALDEQTLKDIGVNRDAMRGALREKIKGLKNKYWREVFDNLDKVTSRLTSASRKAMIERLMSAVNVDFDASNVYTVLVWVVKNANAYFDQQLVEIFKRLSSEKSAVPYKSNRHWRDGSWRSKTSWDIRDGKCGGYALDYRFVLEGNYYGEDWRWGASGQRKELLQDIATIARNLGFCGIDETGVSSDRKEDWTPGEWHPVMFSDGVLFEVKVYQNGNLHFRFHRELMGRMNVEAGRLLGWLTSQAQAEQEMGDKAAKGSFGTSFALDMSNARALAAA